jgi:ADP-heptose:LPS heptosyltransferase
VSVEPSVESSVESPVEPPVQSPIAGRAAREVLIARQDSLGDVLLCGPAIRAVAASGARVTLLCGPHGRAAAELLPGVAETIEWRADWIDPEPQPIDPAQVERFVSLIAARGFERALIFTSFHQSPLPLALLLRMADVPWVAAISDDYPGSLLDVRHGTPSDVHEVERALSLASACGYELPYGDDGRLRLREVGGPYPRAAALAPYVVVHPGASVSARAWPAAAHRQLVERLTAQGRSVVVTGSAQERDLVAFVCGESAALGLAGDTSFAQLAGTIAAAQAIVVANTGPAHLAAAVGTPVVSLYAPTVPSVRWRPWGVPCVLLERDVPCAGCRARECPVPGHPCMTEIGVEQVCEALAALIEGPDFAAGQAPAGEREPSSSEAVAA